MSKERLILTGFMGVGKSTVGPKVAQALGIAYFDTDSWMETESGINVPELVRSDMNAFRRLEASTLEAILELESGVISTGGGIVSTEVGRNALRGAAANVVWMQAPFDDLSQRVLEDTGRERPLFEDPVKARQLYDERMPWYEETSDYSVNALQPANLVVRDIVRVIAPAN